MKGYHLDGNKEMVSLGFMNIIGCISSCYVATGKFDGNGNMNYINLFLFTCKVVSIFIQNKALI